MGTAHAEPIVIFRDDFAGEAGLVSDNSTPEIGDGSWIGGLSLDRAGGISLNQARGTIRFQLDNSKSNVGTDIVTVTAKIDAQGSGAGVAI